MRKHLDSVLDYFAYFSYAPTLQEIYTFFPKKISVQTLKTYLLKEVKNASIVQLSHNRYFRPSESDSYTIPQYSIFREKKIKKSLQQYLKILPLLPFVRFIGVTGASAMSGYRQGDDLDLCIVSKTRYIWTTRFFAVVIAKILGIHTSTGVCLNLFFDEEDLFIPLDKQNSYIAHELVQMKPIIDKDHIYGRFFHVNQWIYTYFPNIRTQRHIKSHEQPHSKRVEFVPQLTHIDMFFKLIQLPIINRNHTSLFISPGQLWLFKNDFEKKLKRKGLVI
ncbi:MAG: hypothetical protein WAV30_05960 [Microgenomates group bacterium]